MTLRDRQQREDKGRGGGGEAQRQTMHYSCENADGALTFHWAIWLHTSRRNAPEAACSSPKTPCVHASSPRRDTSTSVQCCSVSRIRRTFVHSALWREPYPTCFFLFLPGYENGFSRDALTATGTSVKANKLTAFMKSVVKVCFRLTWLELERFMALQVVCRHDRAVAPLCPPTSFTALCCRLVWENFSHSEVRKHEELSESLCSKHTNASVAWNNPSLCWLFMYMQPEAFGKHCRFTFMAYETELAV